MNITITGETKGQRFVVGVDGREHLLTGAIFKVLLRLVWASKLQNLPGKNIQNGWISRGAIQPEPLATKYLYCLNQAIGSGRGIVEKDGFRRVRLLIDRENIKVDCRALKDMPDYEIQKMAEELGKGKP